MNFYVIPMEDAPELGAFYLNVELSGSTYQLNFQYNSREGFWYFDLLDVDGNYIRSGIKIVSNYPLIRLAMMQGRPLGELIAIDTRSIKADPTLEDLGNAVVFGYVE